MRYPGRRRIVLQTMPEDTWTNPLPMWIVEFVNLRRVRDELRIMSSVRYRTNAEYFECKLPGECTVDVLVVDDESLVRLIVSESLCDDGFDVAEACSAEDALMVTGEVGTPAVIVTDVNLGSGMDGLALTAELHRRCPDAGVVIMTGNPSYVGDRIFEPNERFLVKPFAPAKLVSAVRELMGRSAR